MAEVEAIVSYTRRFWHSASKGTFSDLARLRRFDASVDVTNVSCRKRSAKLPGPPARTLKLGRPGWRPGQLQPFVIRSQRHTPFGRASRAYYALGDPRRVFLG